VDEKPVNTSIASQESTVVGVGRRKARSEVDADEIDLIAACRRGEHAAMEMLYHRYKRRVFGLVTKIVGAQDAEEVAQDVFVRIYRGLTKFRGDSALSTWIYRLSVNASLTHLGRRKKRPTHACEDALATVPAPSRPERDPRMAARLEQALAQLPPGYRSVLVLHDIEGLSHEEVAEIVGCRVGTSKSQLHKARAKMRELLGPELAAERATRGK
jgi:RNA polymerase sigma-70 factor (ECF subfamily)